MSNRESARVSIAANSVTLRVREISLTVRSLRVVSLLKGAVGNAGVWSQFLEVKERFKHHAKLIKDVWKS